MKVDPMFLVRDFDAFHGARARAWSNGGKYCGTQLKEAMPKEEASWVRSRCTLNQRVSVD